MSKTDIATSILVALIGAAGTVFAASMGLYKPFENQIENSDLYRVVLAENAGLKVQIAELKQQLVARNNIAAPASTNHKDLKVLNDTNLLLRGEKAALSECVASLEATTSQLRAELAARTSPSHPSQEPPSVKTPTQTVSTVGHRSSHVLRRDEVVRMYDDVTISMYELRNNYGGSLEAQFYINGTGNPFTSQGQRMADNSRWPQKCYFELISLDGQPKILNSQSAKVDYVCKLP